MITRKLCDIVMKDVRSLSEHLLNIDKNRHRHKIHFELDRVFLKMSPSNRDIITVENEYELYMFICSNDEFWIKPSIFMFSENEYEIERKFIDDEAYMFQRSLLEDTFTTKELNEIYSLYDDVQNLRDLWEL